MPNKKPNIKIVDRVDHPGCVTVSVELDMGDGSDIIKENINFGWDAMQLDSRGEPRYKTSIKEWARQMIAIRTDKTLKDNVPKKGDILEVD